MNQVGLAIVFSILYIMVRKKFNKVIEAENGAKNPVLLIKRKGKKKKKNTGFPSQIKITF